MKAMGKLIRLSATDLSNHLACRHLTTLELKVARGEAKEPEWAAPDLKIIQELGDRHEKAYLEFLRRQGKEIADLSGRKDESALIEETTALMAKGAGVIAQGALGNGEWFGRPDILLRVEKPGGKWKWSYEVQDTKLAKETKGTTILQLSLYSELLAAVQGITPEFLWVIPARTEFKGEAYRVAEYAAYCRTVKAQLLAVLAKGKTETYSEPVEHCNVCRWFKECDAKRREDDHLSLVAGLRHQQQEQLEEWRIPTMAKLATMPIPLKERPRRGSREGIERVREQARVQVEGRTEGKLKYEELPVDAEFGLSRLPEPSEQDMFVDLEGDPFAGEMGQQYLFGFVAKDASGVRVYEKKWAVSGEEEKKGFEWLMDEILRRWAADPWMHVYHFGANEPGAFKRLMGQYATREEELDRMLRAGVFVDIHRIFKQGLRASVEEYSLKTLEKFCGFARKTPKEASRSAMRYIEHRLELEKSLDEMPEEIRGAMEGYNAEDCIATAELRDWLEERRRELIVKGANIARPALGDGTPPEDVEERQKRVTALVEELTREVPVEAWERNNEQQARWLLAQLLDWHRREDKATWWEGFRLAKLDKEELLEERSGLGGLRFVERLREERKIPTDRYSFEKQETELREGEELHYEAEKFGTVVAVDFGSRTVDVKKTRKSAELHPSGVYLWDRPYNVKEQAEALYRIGSWAAAGNGMAHGEKYRAALDLLLRRPPRLGNGETLAALGGELPKETACRVALAMKSTVLAIQGPPGAGKTFTGARMICALVRAGKKVGITALGHKVIRKLLEEVVSAGEEEKFKGLRCMQRNDDEEPTAEIAIAIKNEEAWGALASGKANVVGGTSWLWAPEAAFGCVDVLFIDEAGQMALADVISVSQAAKNIVLIGDPQQLERPLKGSHPDGAEKSALQHLLGGHKTIPPDAGILLPETWRLHPSICKFTSELFYEARLGSRKLLEKRVLEGHPWMSGAGLWFVPVEHAGNQNSSIEEVEAVGSIVEGLLAKGVKWHRSEGNVRTLAPEDILIVAPYNAQVADLSARLPKMRIGTVDKFQGQEAPVVIYSMTTSSPEDAPRGMEFLYSLHRLNVATSRAMTAVVLVGSAKLFEPECRTPRQMQLANALCAYREMAIEVDAGKI
ncbi:MAG: TM0106 family RecB-like putative nuclease [Acidobacteria bacterium]|nr:TM0106 family RecB-like putative nuclease [Acidobacteriota bacterium]MBS1867814.1 TM0106 family RecB-like putative nuclease [Acidobacteriota bacterium]